MNIASPANVAVHPTDQLDSDRLQHHVEQGKRDRQRPRRNHWANEKPDDHCPMPRCAPLPYLLESKLFGLAQQGDQDARNTLWVQHARLAFSVIQQFHLPADLLADVLQEGILGLHRAIARFNVREYVAFSTYAWYWIRQGMQRYLNNHRFNMRVPAHEYLDYCRFRYWKEHAPHQPDCLEQMHRLREWHEEQYLRYLDFHAVHEAETIIQQGEEIACRFDPDPNEPEGARETVEIVQSLLACLNDRSKQIICMRFGIQNQSGHTLEEIGTQLQITRERVRQIEEKAINRLRREARRLLKQNASSILEDFLTATPLIDTEETDTVHDPQPNQAPQSPRRTLPTRPG